MYFIFDLITSFYCTAMKYTVLNDTMSRTSCTCVSEKPSVSHWTRIKKYVIKRASKVFVIPGTYKLP